MVGADQGQDRNDGAHEQRTYGEADRELTQRRPTPSELNDGPSADETHQQPVPEQGQRCTSDSHDEYGVRQGLQTTIGRKTRESGHHCENHGENLNDKDDCDSKKQLEPTEALRLSWRNAPLGTDRNEPVQEARNPRLH